MIFLEEIFDKQNEVFGTAYSRLIQKIKQPCDNAKSCLVDRTFNGWNHIMAELREWEKIKQGFSLAA